MFTLHVRHSEDGNILLAPAFAVWAVDPTLSVAGFTAHHILFSLGHKASSETKSSTSNFFPFSWLVGNQGIFPKCGQFLRLTSVTTCATYGFAGYCGSEDPYFHYLFAQCHAALGDMDAARTKLEQVSVMSETLRSRALDDSVFEAIYGAEPISDKQ